MEGEKKSIPIHPSLIFTHFLYLVLFLLENRPIKNTHLPVLCTQISPLITGFKKKKKKKTKWPRPEPAVMMVEKKGAGATLGGSEPFATHSLVR